MNKKSSVTMDNNSSGLIKKIEANWPSILMFVASSIVVVVSFRSDTAYQFKTVNQKLDNNTRAIEGNNDILADIAPVMNTLCESDEKCMRRHKTIKVKGDK